MHCCSDGGGKVWWAPLAALASCVSCPCPLTLLPALPIIPWPPAAAAGWQGLVRPSAATSDMSCGTGSEPAAAAQPLQALRLVDSKLPVARVPGLGIYYSELLMGGWQQRWWDTWGAWVCGRAEGWLAQQPASISAGGLEVGGQAHRPAVPLREATPVTDKSTRILLMGAARLPCRRAAGTGALHEPRACSARGGYLPDRSAPGGNGACDQ